jgi:hypothetical protein
MSRYFLHFMLMIAIASLSEVYAKECLSGVSGSNKLSCQDVLMLLDSEFRQQY